MTSNWQRAALYGMILVGVCGTGTSAVAQATGAQAAAPAWKLVWSDEFNSAETNRGADGASGAAIRGNQNARPRVHRIFLCDRKNLEPRTAGGRQGGALGQRVQSPVRSDFVVPRANGGTGIVREGVLRPRRVSGESHQGTAVGSVCGSYQHGQDVVESTAAVLLFDSLCPDANVAADGLGGHRVGEGAMRNHPPEVAQNRCAGSGDGAQDLDLALRELPLRGTVYACARYG